MRIRDAGRQLWADLSAQRLRTVLTILGITWGTVAVVVLLAFSVGLERQTLKRFHGLGDRIVVLFGGTTTRPWAGFREGRGIRLRETDAEILRREIPGIAMISPEYSDRSTPVRRGRNGLNPNVTGVWPEYGIMRNVIPQPGGRWLNPLDVAERRRVAFIGDEVASVLFGDDDPVGREIEIGSTPFTVIGVLVPKVQNSSYNSRDEDRVFIPASTHAAVFGSVFVNNMVYRTTGSDVTKAVERRVYELLGRKYRFDPGDEDALQVWDTAEWEQMFSYLFLGFKVFFAIVGSFTLSVGGIGVANIMYIVVKERTREIGIKRSVGATRQSILSQFLFESVLIVAIGAAIGVVLSLGIVKGMSYLPMEEFVGSPTISLQVAAVTAGLLTFVAMLAGLFPARRAASLDPVECLR